MEQHGKRIVIVGGGIAGLCAGVYAQKCGYQAEVLEMHDMAGGLATSWRRSGYTFETCLHWLYGSDPKGRMYAQWKEVFDIERLTFVHPEEFARIETDRGETLKAYTNIDRLEAEMLARSPRDAAEIRRFASEVRRLAKFRIPDPTAGWSSNLLTMLHDLPYMPLFQKIVGTSCAEYGKRFTDPLLRSFFGAGEMGRLSAIALFLSFVWLGTGDASYAIGGSQAIIRLIEQKLVSLGGKVRFGAKVNRILVQNGAAAGVQLASGEIVSADWVISAADGHATIYELLGGKYTSKQIDKFYNEFELFPSYLQVSLGVAMDLAQQPSISTRLLDVPLLVDPITELPQISFRFFHFDPTFAPEGKTAVTCFLPTFNHDYWVQLHKNDPAGYHAEKQRIAEAVIAILERKVPDIRAAIEVIDVATPATVIRYTGNWKGSMEGWFLPPGSRFRPLPNTLPGLRQFMMVGQWVLPGGGLPSGPMTARPAIQAICRQDHVPFLPRKQDTLKPLASPPMSFPPLQKH
jgi:phytoene dehydrogenase-like protein